MEGISFEDLATAAQLAQELEVTVRVVTEAARKGLIPGAHNVLGRYYFELEVAKEGWRPYPVAISEGDIPQSHDARGKFAKGNVLGFGSGRGRAPRAKEAAYLVKLHECVSIEDWEYVCRRALADAKKGDRHARRWLSEYLLGKPAQRIIADIDIEHSQKLTAAERLIILKELLGLEAALSQEKVTSVRVLEGSKSHEAEAAGQLTAGGSNLGTTAGASATGVH